MRIASSKSSNLGSGSPKEPLGMLDNMRMQIDLLEKQTRRKEQLLKVTEGRLDIGASVAKNEEINLMYLQAIESKLAFLSNI